MTQKTSSHAPAPPRTPAHGHGTRTTRTAALLVFAAIAFAPTIPAQPDTLDPTCFEPGMNVQCNEFGSIMMENQRDIRGEPILINVTAILHTVHLDADARWIMFSVRHSPEDGSSPISIAPLSFTSPFGDIITSSVDQATPSEVNFWVHVIDVPLDTPTTIEVLVGASERGAFRLEALVMAFDRAYEPIKGADGTDQSLFSFTLLGVNGETKRTATASTGEDKFRAPGPGAALTFGALLAIAALVTRRRLG